MCSHWHSLYKRPCSSAHTLLSCTVKCLIRGGALILCYPLTTRTVHLMAKRWAAHLWEEWGCFCAVIDPLVYWSAESPIFYCLDLFFFVFSMICIFRSSLTLWLNFFFRLLREIECRTLNFFWLVQFRE